MRACPSRAPAPRAFASATPLVSGARPCHSIRAAGASAALGDDLTGTASQALLDAFAILRRARTDQDAAVAERPGAEGTRPVAGVAGLARLLRSTRRWQGVGRPVARRRPTGLLCAPAGDPGRREGLAVVAIGDAASGGGGALDDLVAAARR